MIFRLNNKFYNLSAVKNALEAFSHICYGTILNDKFDIELELKTNIQNIEYELSNYVLGLMKNDFLI